MRLTSMGRASIGCWMAHPYVPTSPEGAERLALSCGLEEIGLCELR